MPHVGGKLSVCLGLTYRETELLETAWGTLRSQSEMFRLDLDEPSQLSAGLDPQAIRLLSSWLSSTFWSQQLSWAEAKQVLSRVCEGKP